MDHDLLEATGRFIDTVGDPAHTHKQDGVIASNRDCETIREEVEAQ